MKMLTPQSAARVVSQIAFTTGSVMHNVVLSSCLSVELFRAVSSSLIHLVNIMKVVNEYVL